MPYVNNTLVFIHKKRNNENLVCNEYFWEV